MKITLRLLDGFWILAAQMKRKDAYVTNKRKFPCFHFQKCIYLVKHQGVSPRNEPDIGPILTGTSQRSRTGRELSDSGRRMSAKNSQKRSGTVYGPYSVLLVAL